MIFPPAAPAQWVPTGGPYGGHVNSIAVAGTNIFVGAYDGVFLSTDSGTSWKSANTGLPNTIVVALAVSGTSLFAGTAGGGVFRSTNKGTGWEAASTGLTTAYAEVFALSGNTILAGTDIGLFHAKLGR